MTVAKKPRVTLQAVADAAQVSVATASYALNGRTDRTRQLPQQTVERVLEAARALGYRGNSAARALRRQRTELIALVYRPPVGPWLDRLTIQCEDIAASHGYSVVGLPIRRPERALHSLRVLELGYVDGVICTDDMRGVARPDMLRELVRGLVMFDDHWPADGLDVVRTNGRRAVAEATAYLLQQGRRRIAYLYHGEQLNPLRSDRYLGYQDALTADGRKVDHSLICDGASYRERAVVNVRKLLEGRNPPDALVSESDRGALAAIQAAQSLSVKVPDDFAVIGVGNTQEGEFSSPALTSVGTEQLDFTEIIEALFTRIDNPGLAGREISMPWVLNRRESA